MAGTGFWTAHVTYTLCDGSLQPLPVSAVPGWLADRWAPYIKLPLAYICFCGPELTVHKSCSKRPLYKQMFCMWQGKAPCTTCYNVFCLQRGYHVVRGIEVSSLCWGTEAGATCCWPWLIWRLIICTSLLTSLPHWPVFRWLCRQCLWYLTNFSEVRFSNERSVGCCYVPSMVYWSENIHSMADLGLKMLSWVQLRQHC
jgi:hypothetical protein